MPLFRHKSKLIHFIHIPKTGGTLIEYSLTSSGAIQALFNRKKNKFSKVTMQHLHYEYYKQIIPKDFADWSFAVVRNPYDRIVSEYKMKILRIRKSDQTFDSFVLESFERCLENKQHRDNHIRPQSDFITDYIDTFKIEDGLDIPLKTACKKLGLPYKGIPKVNTGTNIRIKASYTTVDNIKQFYFEDFNLFNYQLDFMPESLEIST
mgnify:CR=1 FL=1